MRRTERLMTKRIAAGTFCLFLILTLLLSGLYVAVEAGHECTGEECTVCAVIHWCGTILRNSGLTAVPTLSACAGSIAVAAVTSVIFFRICTQVTPVEDKVRLNN